MLPLKAMEAVNIPGNEGRQDPDCHVKFQNNVTSAVYFAHPARTQQVENFIAIQLRACG